MTSEYAGGIERSLGNRYLFVQAFSLNDFEKII